jgi:hypothetical protein
MPAKTLLRVILIATVGLTVSACSTRSVQEREIKSAKSGDLTITLSSASGELKNGDNELFVSFSDSSNRPVDVGAASLNFQMAAMGTMPEMNNKAKLTTTDTAGKYRATVELEMAGTWESVISFEGAHGDGQARMTVNVK